MEEQQLELSFGEEYSMFSIAGDYASVDSSRFNNKLNIENVYSEIGGNGNIYAIPEKSAMEGNSKWIKTRDNLNLPEYSVIDLSKKYEERMKKSKSKEQVEGINDLSAKLNNFNIYEDIEINHSKDAMQNVKKQLDELNIYEPV